MAIDKWTDGSSNWNSADWSGGLPISTSNVVVAEGDPQVTSAISIASLVDSAQVNFSDAGASTIAGAVTNTGGLTVDSGYENGGSTLTISGLLTNSGSINIGNGALGAATTVTANALTNFIGTTLGTLDIGGATGVRATLDIESAAGLGATGSLCGSVNLSSDSLLEFASGQIQTIAANSELTLSGPNAFVADASSPSTNSALTGLTTIVGSLSLNDIAPLTLSGALYNAGNLSVDSSYADGGSALNVTGALTNTGTVDIGNGNLTAATTVKANGLTNFIGTRLGTINLTGNSSASNGGPYLVTLNVAGAAGFGVASELTGSVNLSGDALLEFASGEITEIAAISELTISGPSAFVADASNTSANSALTGLATIAGSLSLNDTAPLTLTGALSNSGTLSVDSYYDDGGSALTVTGALTNTGTVDIGNGALSEATSVKATGLTNFLGAKLGTINLSGDTDGAPIPISATLDITGAAGFGVASELLGSVNLSGNANGDALLEFASGEITKIAADSELTLSGPDAFVADASNTSADSALTGLATIAGGLTLNDAAPLTLSGALSSSGALSIDSYYDDGGSALTVSGALTNTGTVDIGNAALSAATTVKASALTNFIGASLGTINLSGDTDGAPLPVSATLDITGAAGFGIASELLGSVNLSGNANGDALLEFASGEITKIAADSELTLSGPDAFVADASNTSANSALTGLTTIAGGLTLNGAAPLTLSGSLSNSGDLNVDANYADGGSSLTVTGTLTNTGTLDIGNAALSAATLVKVALLHNFVGGSLGTINLSGDTDGAPVPISATLYSAGSASFGVASELLGAVNLSGNANGHALLEFASGEITEIAANGELTLSGPDAFVADASNTSTNSALTALATIAGSLTLNDSAPLTLSGALSNSGNLSIDNNYSDGGSALTVSGALTNTGSVNIGNGALVAATTVKMTALNNSVGASLGTVNIIGNTDGAPAPVSATLDITGAAGFGVASELLGSVNLSGDVNGVALLEFASGEITKIGANSELTLSGPDAFVADASNTSTNSALTGLATIAGSLNLNDSAPLTLSGALSNSGNLNVDSNYADGGSSLTVTGALTNTGAVNIGNGSLGASTTVTVTSLTNSGQMTLNGSSSLATLVVKGSAVNTGSLTIGASSELDVTNSNAFKQSAGTTTVSGTLVASNIQALGGLLDFTSAIVSGDGTNGLTIGSSGALEFAASVDSSHTVTFTASTGKLELASPGSFGGTISGFTGSDIIDLLGVTVTGLSYSGTSTSGTLTVSGSSGAIAKLNFVGDYTTSSFSYKSDGSGGTEILDPPTSTKTTATTSLKAPLDTTYASEGIALLGRSPATGFTEGLDFGRGSLFGFGQTSDHAALALAPTHF